jgi:hypothetical protein
MEGTRGFERLQKLVLAQEFNELDDARIAFGRRNYGIYPNR